MWAPQRQHNTGMLWECVALSWGFLPLASLPLGTSKAGEGSLSPDSMGTLWDWLVKWEPAQTTRDPSQDRLCLALTAGTSVLHRCPEGSSSPHLCVLPTNLLFLVT